MFYKCTVCQAKHDPPLPPAQHSTLTHCPSCGNTVTLIQHDTERPPTGEAEPVHVTAMGAVQSFCSECAGKYILNAKGELDRIDHAPSCSAVSELVAPGRFDVGHDDDDDGLGDRLPKLDRETVE